MSKPDLILTPPKGRRGGRTASINDRRVVAEVTLFPTGIGRFGKLEIRMGIDACDPEEPYRMARYPDHLRIEYQMHTKADTWYRPARGFLAGVEGWSEAYAETFTCCDMDAFAQWAKLVKRAKDAARKRFVTPRTEKRADGTTREYAHFKEQRGDALILIVGLRLIGVEVRIYSQQIRDRHARRDSAKVAA